MSSSSSSLGLDLFSKSHYLASVTKELERILQLPKTERSEWLAHNADSIELFARELARDSVIALDGLEGDQQERLLSIEYMANLKATMNVLNGIMSFLPSHAKARKWKVS